MRGEGGGMAQGASSRGEESAGPGILCRNPVQECAYRQYGESFP